MGTGRQWHFCPYGNGLRMRIGTISALYIEWVLEQLCVESKPLQVKLYLWITKIYLEINHIKSTKL